MTGARRRGEPGGVVVTGASRLAGSLADALAADVPVRQLAHPELDAGRLAAALSGAGTVVHLAASRDPTVPAAVRAADLAGTAVLLEAARAAGVRRVVLVTSTEVHRGRPGRVPMPESSPVAPRDDQSLVGSWTEVERLADHARRTGVDVVVARPAALAGAGPEAAGGLLRSLAAPRLLAVRAVEPLWQLCHVDDLVTGLALAARGAVRRTFAVASAGWLTQTEVERLSGRRRLELPAAVVLSTAERLHRLGVAPGAAAGLDALTAPVVVDPARLRAAGWTPQWTAQEALLAHLDQVPGAVGEWTTAYAASTAGATAAVLGTAALVRRARRRRRR